MTRKSATPQDAARPFAYRNRTLHCDGVSLATLAEKYSTPLYVYSAGQITQRFQLFEQAFAARPHTICYAVKANSSLAIMRLLAQQGAGFDIVSGGELERVRKAHKPALKKVVFSGVGKQIWEIDAALRANILLFNVESEAELYLLALQHAPAGTLFHATDGSSYRVREIAEAAGATAESWPLEEARKTLGAYADALVLDQLVSSEKARSTLGWLPEGISILEDLRNGSYVQ